MSRPDDQLRALMQTYPDLGKDINRAYQEKGKRLPDWPDDVLLQHWAWMDIVHKYYPDYDLYDFDDHQKMITLAMSMQAVGTWRYSRDIYCFESEVYEALLSTELPNTIPLKVFRRLPSWSVYVSYPQQVADGSYGFYANLDYELGTGAWELLLTPDIGKGSISFPLELAEGISLKDAIYSKEHEEKLKDIGAPEGLAATATTYIDAAVDLLKTPLSLLLYLCSEAPEIDSEREPSISPARVQPKKVKSGIKLFAPSVTRTWDVGKKTGELIRQAKEIGTVHGHKSPHIRRAHWHGYWTGSHKGERVFGYQWLAPIIVNAEELDKRREDQDGKTI